jgi:hypothetical protein
MEYNAYAEELVFGIAPLPARPNDCYIIGDSYFVTLLNLIFTRKSSAQASKEKEE